MTKIIKSVNNVINTLLFIYNMWRFLHKWKGSQVDLMEIVYILYYSGKLVDKHGRNAKLVDISNFVFTMLGCKPPQNPSRVLKTIRMRAKPEELSVVFKSLCDLYLQNFDIKK